MSLNKMTRKLNWCDIVDQAQEQIRLCHQPPTECCSDHGPARLYPHSYHCWLPPYPQAQSWPGPVWAIVNTSNHFTERPTRGNHQWERKSAYYRFWPPHTLCLFTEFARKFPPDSLIYNFPWAAKSSPCRLLLLLLLCYPSMAFSWSIKQKRSAQAKVWPTSGTNNPPVTHRPHLAIGNNNVGGQVITTGKLEEEIYEFQSKGLACCIPGKVSS